jgi:hypothetical protein
MADKLNLLPAGALHKSKLQHVRSGVKPAKNLSRLLTGDLGATITRELMSGVEGFLGLMHDGGDEDDSDTPFAPDTGTSTWSASVAGIAEVPIRWEGAGCSVSSSAALYFTGLGLCKEERFDPFMMEITYISAAALMPALTLHLPTDASANGITT